MGVSHSYVTKIEAGRFQVPPDKLQAFAQALDIAAGDLFTLAGYPLPEGLPTFAPYLRRRYGEELPDQAIEEITAYFEQVRGQYTTDLGDAARSSQGGVR